MDAEDSIPVGIYDDFESEEEREEALLEAFTAITYAYYEAKHHDSDGFFAYEVGSPQCLALGHSVHDDLESDPLYGDGTHIMGWTEPICSATRYGVACTYCEGECDHQLPRVKLWTLVADRADRSARR